VIGGNGGQIVRAAQIGAGGLVLGGLGVSRALYGSTGNGGLVLGGLGVAKAASGTVGAGGLVLGGLGVQTIPFAHPGSGGLVLGGLGVQLAEVAQVGAGGLVLGGQGRQWVLAGQVGAGGLVLGGQGAPQGVVTQIGSGGLMFGGAGVQILPFGQVGAGGLMFGGVGNQMGASAILEFGRVDSTGALSLTTTSTLVPGAAITLGPYAVDSFALINAVWDMDAAGTAQPGDYAVGHIVVNGVQQNESAILRFDLTTSRMTVSQSIYVSMMHGTAFAIELFAVNLIANRGVAEGTNTGFTYTVVGS
jgi:hypothetical protein